MAKPGRKTRFMPASGTAGWREEIVKDWGYWEGRFRRKFLPEVRSKIEGILSRGRTGRSRYPGVPLTKFFVMLEQYRKKRHPTKVTFDDYLRLCWDVFDDPDNPTTVMQLEVVRQAIYLADGDVSRLFSKLRDPETRDAFTSQIQTEENEVIPQLAKLFRDKGVPVTCSTRLFKEGEKGYPNATAFEAFCIEYVLYGDPKSASDRRRVGTARTHATDIKR